MKEIDEDMSEGEYIVQADSAFVSKDMKAIVVKSASALRTKRCDVRLERFCAQDAPNKCREQTIHFHCPSATMDAVLEQLNYRPPMDVLTIHPWWKT